MNTTQILLAAVFLLALGGIVSIPGLLAYRSMLLRSPVDPEEHIKRLQMELDDMGRQIEAQERGMDTLRSEVRQLTWKNAELANAVVRLSAQVVALGGRPVVDADKLLGNSS